MTSPINLALAIFNALLLLVIVVLMRRETKDGLGLFIVLSIAALAAFNFYLAFS